MCAQTERMQALSSEVDGVEVFKEAELMVNITRHQLVPPHQELTEDEKKAVLAK